MRMPRSQHLTQCEEYPNNENAFTMYI